jgi:phosphohistidine phosphatase SixA
VGHEPYLSELISVLLTGRLDLPLALKKGGVCRLTANRLHYGRCATLEWLLTPRVVAGS